MTEWLTYGPIYSPKWIDELDTTPFVKNQLRREVRRLAELVSRRRWFGKEEEPIPEGELDNLRHDLRLWSDPVAVRDLVNSHNRIFFLGPKSLIKARAAIDAYIEGLTDEQT